MNKRTRLFVVVASSVLVIGVGTAGLASYVGLEKIGLAGLGGSDELSYMPRSAQLVAYVDVRHVMDSELRKKLQPRLTAATGNPKDDIFKETGINIETDVDSIFVGASQESFAGGQDEPPLVLVRGRFDESRIQALAASHGGVSDQYMGVRILTSEKIGVAFLEPGLVAVGPPSAVRLALDTRYKGGGSIKDNDEVMRLVNRVEHANTWVVAKFDALQQQNRVPVELVRQLPAITWFSASGQVDSGLSALVHAETRDDQAAKDLREVIRGFVTLVRMQVSQQEGLAEVVNSIELSGEGTTVSLGFSIPSATIDRLGALTAQQRPKVPAADQAPRRQSPPRIPAGGSPSI